MIQMRLPSFSGLTAFYAAVRHGSLTGAARELNVSQPAISRRIAALEADLGCPLFDRTHKPVRLTEQGRELSIALRGGFDMIETATDRLRRAASGRTVSVSAPSGFVAYWLIPRLGDLQAAFPETTIRIISLEHDEPGRRGDIAIRFGAPDATQPDETKILGEDVFPAASPLYLSRVRRPETVKELGGHTLLTTESGRRYWYDWDSWFDAVGVPRPAGTRTLDFSAYAMLVSAALAGQGICLCWPGLLDSFLATGALIRLTEVSASSGRGYFLALREGKAAPRTVQAVADWIRDRATTPEPGRALTQAPAI